MRAMVLKATGNLEPDGTPLEPVELPLPQPGRNEVRLRVAACGVCHTELDEIAKIAVWRLSNYQS